jgi:poly-gamma-glutamate synthesis protein (capsule biosynthesis protein)
LAETILVKIDLFGDWCPGDKVVDFKYKSEIALLNVEGPIIQKDFDFIGNQLDKLGPSLFSKTSPTFSDRFVFSLANNHIMDFGLFGVKKTLESLESKGNLSVGFCSEFHDFHEVSMDIGMNRRLTVIANAEHQFGYSTGLTGGYIALSPEMFDLIRLAKGRGDYVIVSSHGGDEKSLLPSFERRELFRNYIEAGADVVWGHHAHVPQGWEFWGDGLICYGLGNFVTDPNLISHDKLGQYSLMVTIDLQNLKKSEFKITRQKLNLNTLEIEVMKLPQSIFDKHFYVINHILQSDDLLQQYLDMYSSKIVKDFYSKFISFAPFSFSLRNSFYSALSRIKNMGEDKYGDSVRKLSDHVDKCESHRYMIKYYNERKKVISHKGNYAMRSQHKKLENAEWDLDANQ